MSFRTGVCRPLARRAFLVLVGGLAAALSAAPAGAQIFQPLPGLDPQDVPYSAAYGVSGDGAIVVGVAGVDAVRWPVGGALEVLGVPANDLTAEAVAASLDGSVIVGAGFTGNVGSAFRWTQPGGFQDLGGTDSRAHGVSDDGLIVAGSATDPRVGATRAFRWTQAEGLKFLGAARGGLSSRALGISGDGNVIVGQTDARQGPQAFLITPSAGLVTLGTLPGDSTSLAVDASLTGSVVVGHSGASLFPTPAGQTTQMFRRAQSTMTGLGDLAGGRFGSVAHACSANGNTIVGSGTNDTPAQAAVLWTSTNGLLDLQNLLSAEYGVDLTGWTLTEATGVSADGLTIVGNGLNPAGQMQGWVAVLPAPPVQSAPVVNMKVSAATVAKNTTVTVTLTATRTAGGSVNPVIGVRATITATSALGSQVIGNSFTNVSGQLQISYRPSPALGPGLQLIQGAVTLVDGTSGESATTLRVLGR